MSVARSIIMNVVICKKNYVFVEFLSSHIMLNVMNLDTSNIYLRAYYDLSCHQWYELLLRSCWLIDTSIRETAFRFIIYYVNCRDNEISDNNKTFQETLA